MLGNEKTLQTKIAMNMIWIMLHGIRPIYLSGYLAC